MYKCRICGKTYSSFLRKQVVHWHKWDIIRTVIVFVIIYSIAVVYEISK